jgi:predicted O-methyltransferase YrrM
MGDTLRIEDDLTALSQFLQVPRRDLETHYDDLVRADDFLAELNRLVSGAPGFEGAHFEHVADLRVYRSLLYLMTRAAKPALFVETGVLNGFSSAFILLAMEHNDKGRLISIDLPSSDARILNQGTGEIPAGKKTGWAIPDALRRRHDLRLGAAESLLPATFAELQSADIFLHDSDHSYTHMMFELSLAWKFVRAGGWILADNIEQNHAFADFARATNARSLVVNSFVRPERTWSHGILERP